MSQRKKHLWKKERKKEEKRKEKRKRIRKGIKERKKKSKKGAKRKEKRNRVRNEPEIIKIRQSSHYMYSNNILNFQESTIILNGHTKNVWKLIACTSYKSDTQNNSDVESWAKLNTIARMLIWLVRVDSHWVTVGYSWESNSGHQQIGQQNKAIDCGIVVSEFEPESRYYVTFGKGVLDMTLNCLMVRFQ